MNAQTVIQTSALPGFIPAAKIRRSIRTLLPMLALCSAVVAWSQVPSNLPGPEFPPNMPPEAIKVPPTPIPTGILSARQRIQRAHASAHDPATATPAQTPETVPETAQYYFVNFAVPNSTYVQPNAINNAGLVAGYYLDANYVSHGFVWTEGTVQTIDYPGATGTIFGGINNRGVVSGTYQDVNGNTYAITYSLANSAWTVLPEIPGGWRVLPLGAVEGNIGINDDGVVAGCAQQSVFGVLSWIWHPDSQSYSYFTAPAAAEASTCGEGVNNRRNVVGTMFIAYSDFFFAFLREGREQYTTIAVPSSLSGGLFPPFGINDSDTIVGSLDFAVSATFPGFIQTRGGVFKLVNEPPGYEFTSPTGINDFGVLCGNTSSTATGQFLAFVAFPQK
jgi:hypothetical protein